MAGPVRRVAGVAAEASGPDVTGRAGAGTPRPARRRRWAWGAGFAAAGIALFAAYIRLSATYPVNSDGANIVLMAWDMLHGNLVLHNWWMSDVSFYTTELPEYMLIDAIRGLSPDVTHIAAALTYTLAVVLAALLAKGRANSREGLARVLLSGGIMLAPQLGVGIFVLLLSVGHIGTAVPALAVWLLLDLSPRRWYIPVIAGVMLAWAMIADSLVLVVAIAPLVIVGVSRAVPLLATGRPGSGTAPRLRSAWYELSLAAAAAAAWGASWLAEKAIHALGGYTLHAVPFSLVTPAAPGRARGDHGRQPAGTVRRQLRRPALRRGRRVRRAAPGRSGPRGLGAGPCAPPVRQGRPGRSAAHGRHHHQPRHLPVQQLFLRCAERPGDRADPAVRGGPGRAQPRSRPGPGTPGPAGRPAHPGAAGRAGRLRGLPGLRAGPAGVPAGQRPARVLAAGPPPRPRAERVLAGQRGDDRQRRQGHDPRGDRSGRRDRALPVGSQEHLVQPRPPVRQLRRAAEPARLLQLLVSPQSGQCHLRRPGPHVPAGALHGAGLGAQPDAGPARLGRAHGHGAVRRSGSGTRRPG